LTSANFLKWYRKILKPGGRIHLKTDSPELYAFTLETLAEEPNCTLYYHNDDIYSQPSLHVPELALKTYYEKKHLEDKRTIKYIQFGLE
jgi:tRNA (guanine-N7-)-methyltransferase